MARKGLRDLPPVLSQFDPELAPECKFETADDALQEDLSRAKSLNKGLANSRRRRRKARSLARALARVDSDPKSMASSRYMRAFRRLFAGHIWHLIAAEPAIPVSTVTIIPKGWHVAANKLKDVDPRKYMRQIRTDMDRAVARAKKENRDTTGWAIFFLHGEHEPESDLYILHVHGALSGGMIDIVRSMSRKKKYRSSKKPDSVDQVAQRIRVSQAPLTKMPYPITYIAKSYWPSRRIGEVGPEPGNIGRTRWGHRLPEPYHAKWLRWIDHWSVSDFGLLYGVYINRSGFVAR